MNSLIIINIFFYFLEKVENVENKKQKGLIFKCNSDESTTVNKLEYLQDIIWLELPTNIDYNLLPDNYFNVILWSDCDVESEIINVIVVSKIKEKWENLF